MCETPSCTNLVEERDRFTAPKQAKAGPGRRARLSGKGLAKTERLAGHVPLFLCCFDVQIASGASHPRPNLQPATWHDLQPLGLPSISCSFVKFMPKPGLNFLKATKSYYALIKANKSIPPPPGGGRWSPILHHLYLYPLARLGSFHCAEIRVSKSNRYQTDLCQKMLLAHACNRLPPSNLRHYHRNPYQKSNLAKPIQG